MPSIPVGADITGLGKPDLIVSEWKGGGHCCYVFHVLELGEVVREVATVNAWDSCLAHFEDVNQDGVYEFVAQDFTFAYWHASFAESPAPVIVLRFNGTNYEFAPDLMRRPAPGQAELATVISRIRALNWDKYPTPALWEAMLELIYNGNSDILTSEAWVPTDVPMQQFLEEFCGQLATSVWFGKLRTTIPRAPCKFDPRLGHRT